MPVVGLVRSIRKHNKTFWPPPRKTKKGMTLLNVLLKTVKPRLFELVCITISNWSFSSPVPIYSALSLSCAGTIINRQGMYYKRFFGFRKRSILLESSGICRNGRGVNAKNAWKVANDGSCKAGSFQFFLYQKNQVRVCFSSQSKEYWSKIKRW